MNRSCELILAIIIAMAPQSLWCRETATTQEPLGAVTSFTDTLFQPIPNSKKKKSREFFSLPSGLIS